MEIETQNTKACLSLGRADMEKESLDHFSALWAQKYNTREQKSCHTSVTEQ